MTTHRGVTVAALIVMGGALALGVFRFFAGVPDDPDGILSSAAFAAPFFTAGVLALLGELRGHPLFVATAGLALWPMALVSIIMWPLLAPAALLVWRGMEQADRRSEREFPVSVVIVAGLWGAFALLLFHKDPVSWQTPTGSGSSSDIITTVEAVATMAIMVAVLASALLIPRRARLSAR